MAKIETNKAGLAPVEGVQGVREQLWAEFLANYKAKNPVKFAAKDAVGAFKVIPASFLGVVKEEKVLGGGVRRTIR